MIDPITGMIIAGGISGLGSMFSAGAERKREEEKEKRARDWAKEMVAKYPELKGLELPEIAPQAMKLVSTLMKGGLPPAMIKALGLGAEQEYGTALAGMPQGVGPIALGKMKAGVMGRLGQTKAMMGFQGMQVGLGAVPQISDLMMQPQKYGAEEQRRRWKDISGMYASVPGAAAGNIPAFGTVSY